MNKNYVADQGTMNMFSSYWMWEKQLDKHAKIIYRRTPQAYCQNLIYDGKSVGRVYMFGLKARRHNKYPGFKIHGWVARFHISEKYRKNGYAIQMMSDLIDKFGYSWTTLHISSVSPNRISNLTDENREEYRNKLYKFYKHFGFRRVNDKNTAMIRE